MVANLEKIVVEAKLIAEKLTEAGEEYLKKYPDPVKRWIFGSHTNQGQAKQFITLGQNFIELADQVSEVEVTKFLILIYNKLDALSNGELKKQLTDDGRLESYTTSIIAELLNKSVESVRLNVNLSGSGIGGKSIAGYLSDAEERIKTKEVSMKEMTS